MNVHLLFFKKKLIVVELLDKALLSFSVYLEYV